MKTHAADLSSRRIFRGRMFLLLGLSSAALFSAPLEAVSPRPESARAFGMGNGFSAVGNDYNAMFFNPAGLGNVKHVEVAGLAGRSYSEYPFPQSEAHVAGVLPFEAYKPYWKFGTAGMMFHRTGREGEATYTTFGASFGTNIMDVVPAGRSIISELRNLSAGMTLRFRDRGKPDGGFGAGVDMGLLYKFNDGEAPLTSGWSTAIAVQEMNMKSVSSPVLYRFGAAWKNPQSTLTLDFVVENGVGSFQPGVEIAFFRRLLLFRMGSTKSADAARQLTLGLGAVLPPVQLDIGYGFQIEKLSKPNDRVLVSLTYRFGVPLLSQYFYQERLEKADEVENKVSNLESKHETLKTSIRESKELYESMQSDLELAREKREKAVKEIQELENTIEDREEELKKTEEELKKLAEQKAKLIRKEERVNPKVDTRPPFSGDARKHRVMPGDTLRGIAQKFYGDPNQWQVIYDVNEAKIIRGVPKEGEELVIP